MGYALHLVDRGAAGPTRSGAPMKPRSAVVLRSSATVAIAATAVLASACSGGSTANNSARASGSRSGVSYSSCMRSSGVPSFPDPGPDGGIPKGDAQHFGVSDAAFRSAETTCRHLLPSSSGSFAQASQQCLLADVCPPAVVQQILAAQRAYSRCVRSHGFPNWPDPTVNAQRPPYFDVSGAGITSAAAHSRRFMNIDRICERLVGVHGDVPVDIG